MESDGAADYLSELPELAGTRTAKRFGEKQWTG